METQGSNISLDHHIQSFQYFRERVLRNILIGLSIAGTFFIFASGYIAISNENFVILGLYLVLYFSIIAMTFIKNIPYNLRSGTLLGIILMLAASNFLEKGLSGNGTILLFFFIVTAAILLGLKGGVITAGIALFVLFLFAAGMSTGLISPPPQAVQANSAYLSDWIFSSILFVFLVAVVIRSINTILGGMNASFSKTLSMLENLHMERHDLKSDVDRNTQQISRKAIQLETASELIHEISLQSDPEMILQDAIYLIRDRFDYYHVSLFMVDELKEFAVIKASTGNAGKQLLANNHRLRFGEGVVGYAVMQGKPRLASDVLLDSVHYRNPLLPDTRSEVAIPLRVGSEIIGALDVQSRFENAFSEDDIKSLQMVADGVAVAVSNTEKIASIQKQLEAYEQESKNTTKKSWQEFIRASKINQTLKLQDARITAVNEVDEDILAVRTSGKPYIKNAESETDVSVIALPLKVRDEVIGVLDVHMKTRNINAQTLNLMESISERLSIALENTRLMEELENRTNQERLIASITDKVRATSEIDRILSTTAREIGTALGVAEVLIQLDTPDTN